VYVGVSLNLSKLSKLIASIVFNYYLLVIATHSSSTAIINFLLCNLYLHTAIINYALGYIIDFRAIYCPAFVVSFEHYITNYVFENFTPTIISLSLYRVSPPRRFTMHRIYNNARHYRPTTASNTYVPVLYKADFERAMNVYLEKELNCILDYDPGNEITFAHPTAYVYVLSNRTNNGMLYIG